MEFTLIAVVIVALFFDFTNGFHDTANAIATSISTKAMSPRVAVIGAAAFNFIGAFVSIHVAATIASGIVNAHLITLTSVLAGLSGAIVWNLITWRAGLPSSSSHGLVGGILGAVITANGLSGVNWTGLEQKVLIPSLLSPFIGLVVALILMAIIIRAIRHRPEKQTDKLFRRLQLVSSAFVAFTHGTNDAQKTMGVIALALLTVTPDKTFHVPLWVIVSSASAMALGTYLGGWRIIQTMGEKITKMDPPQGFAAQTATATTLWVTSQLGFPVSTTQTVSGSIVGAGTAKSVSSVNWKVIKHIVAAWLITIPCAALMGSIAEGVAKSPNGIGVSLVLLVIVAAGIYVTRNWTWEARAQLKTMLSILQRRPKP